MYIIYVYCIICDFQGEKNNGFDVLYHNMKYGLDASKEFSDFLRERCLLDFTTVGLFSVLLVFVFTSVITSMARNSLLCADVPLRNYSLTHSLSVLV